MIKNDTAVENVDHNLAILGPNDYINQGIMNFSRDNKTSLNT
jgi:hypothetical protein